MGLDTGDSGSGSTPTVRKDLPHRSEKEGPNRPVGEKVLLVAVLHELTMKHNWLEAC